MIPGWHPFVVNFPVALNVTALLLFLAARLFKAKAEMLATVATWNLILGAVTAVIALASGLGAVLDLEVSDAAHRAISSHMKWALFTSLALILLALWRSAGNPPDAKPSGLFLIVLTVAVLALGFTAYRGVVNVFGFGVGVLG
jgi:uncharacterized membrane protein